MNADAYFTIGSPHQSACEPCQDYALAGTLDSGIAYALVSDGSSCGGHDVIKGLTDIGARLVAHAFLHAIGQFDARDVVEAIASGAVRESFSKRLLQTRFTQNANDLLATLVAVVSDGTSMAVICLGDGVIAATHKDGSTKIVEVSWNGNFPYYPAYPELGWLEGFLAQHRQLLGLTETAPQSDVLAACIDEVSAAPDGTLGAITQTQVAAMSLIPNGLIRIFAVSEIKSITVFSDGVTQMPGEGGTLALAEAVLKFTSFKNTNGRFVARRARAALSKEIKAAPKDDFAVAGIWNGD